MGALAAITRRHRPVEACTDQLRVSVDALAVCVDVVTTVQLGHGGHVHHRSHRYRNPAGSIMHAARRSASGTIAENPIDRRANVSVTRRRGDTPWSRTSLGLPGADVCTLTIAVIP